MLTKVKERPIVLRAHEVRAILEGRKTQTRRPIKGDPCWDVAPLEFTNSPGWWAPNEAADYRRCPFGVPGDRLWVREAWGYPDASKGLVFPSFVSFRADRETPKGSTRWRPAIHMPRWASRLTLEIVSVRMERVQDITEAASEAEGLKFPAHMEGLRYVASGTWRSDVESDDGSWLAPSRRAAFVCAWDSLYAETPHAWAANPWVWVVEFKRECVGERR